MKPRTALRLGAAAPIIMAILVAWGLKYRHAEQDRLGDSLSRVERVGEHARSLGRLTRRCLLDENTSLTSRWYKVYADLGLALEEIRTAPFLDRSSVESLHSSYVSLRSKFGNLHGDNIGREGRIEFLDSIEDVHRKAFRIASLCNSRATSKSSEVDTVAIRVFLVLSLLVSGAIVFSSDWVANKLDSMSDGLKALSAGNVEQWAEKRGGSPRDPLFSSVRNIGERYEKEYEELEEEAKQQGEIKTALRKANTILSDSITKLRQSQSRVLDAERLRALSQVSAGVAHRFTDCLERVLVTSDYLIKCPAALARKDESARHLKRLNKAALEARTSVVRLWDYFHPGGLTTSGPVDIVSVIDKTIESTRPLWEEEDDKGQSRVLVTSDAKDIPTFEGESSELEACLVNLVFNAVEAIGRDSGTIRISAMSDAGSVIVAVADDGPGMSEIVKRRCFEPFYSTRTDHSAGLGLTTVSGIVRRHNGTVGVHATPGGGTTVRMSIPLQPPIEQAVQSDAASEEESSLSVLVVHEGEWFCNAMVEMLTVDGHHARAVDTGTDARKALAEGNIDVVIVDMNLPDTNGDEVVRSARDLNLGSRIIMLTGFGDQPGDPNRALSDVRILRKPATLSEIMTEVTKHTSSHT